MCDRVRQMDERFGAEANRREEGLRQELLEAREGRREAAERAARLEEEVTSQGPRTPETPPPPAPAPW